MVNIEPAQLSATVIAYWNLCGESAPSDDELKSAVINIQIALSSGQQIPRITDKTCQPLYGPRLDIVRNAKAKTSSNK